MDLGSGARVWFVPVLLTAAMLIACGSAAPDEIVRPPDAMARGADADRTAIAAGVLPDLRGRELNEVGDQVGTLYELWEVIGTQETLNIANDEVDEGTIFDQIPSPGTPLDGIERWTLYVSAGGPVVEFEDLPLDVARFAEQLPGFDTSEPLVAKGGAYKSDRWLFSLNCGAVDAAYRTFRDARYDTACPGDVQVGPDFLDDD